MRVQPALASALTVTTGAPNTSSGRASAADVRCTLPDAVIVDEPSEPDHLRDRLGWGSEARRRAAPALGGDGDRQCVVERRCPSPRR